jgi:hypothetical protein
VPVGPFVAQRFRHRSRTGHHVDFAEVVSRALVQAHVAPGQREHMIRVCRLPDPQQWLEVEALGHDRSLRNVAGELIHPEEAWGAEDGKPIERLIPELAVTAELTEWLEECLGFTFRILRS